MHTEQEFQSRLLALLGEIAEANKRIQRLAEHNLEPPPPDFTERLSNVPPAEGVR